MDRKLLLKRKKTDQIQRTSENIPIHYIVCVWYRFRISSTVLWVPQPIWQALLLSNLLPVFGCKKTCGILVTITHTSHIHKTCRDINYSRLHWWASHPLSSLERPLTREDFPNHGITTQESLRRCRDRCIACLFVARTDFESEKTGLGFFFCFSLRKNMHAKIPPEPDLQRFVLKTESQRVQDSISFHYPWNHFTVGFSFHLKKGLCTQKQTHIQKWPVW